MTSYSELRELASAIDHQLANDVNYVEESNPSVAYLNSLILTKLNASCTRIGKELILNNKDKNSDEYQSIKKDLDRIITEINYELFKNNRIISKAAAKSNTLPSDSTTAASTMATSATTAVSGVTTVGTADANPEDMSELRKRLLSSSLDDGQKQELNEHHENLQQEVMKDISNLVNYIKQGAVQLQQSIESDKENLDKAEENISNTTSSFNLNLSNLSQFHKRGKLSYWELAKICALFLLLVVVTMFFISIF